MSSRAARQIRDYLRREGVDASSKRNFCLTKETGERNIDLIGDECGGSECVSA